MIASELRFKISQKGLKGKTMRFFFFGQGG